MRDGGDGHNRTVGINRYGVGSEFGRRNYFETDRQPQLWKILHVMRDDSARASNDSRSYNVLIVGIRETVGSFQSFPSNDFRIGKRRAHPSNEIACPLLGLGLPASAFDQLANFAIFEFF